MCLFSLCWYTCGFSTQSHAAGGPSGVPLLADSGWLLYSCGDGFAWGWGLSCHSCPVPPLFSFLCLHSFPFCCFPFGVLPPYRVGWHVCLQFAGLLFGVVEGVLLRLFPQCLCAVFPAAGTLGFLGFSCSACLLGWLGLCTLCQGVPVAVLSAWFAGGVPLLPFPYLRWVYFWLRCLQSLWAMKAVSVALRGSSSSSGVCWSISFFWSWGGFWSRVGGSSCDSWFWSLLMLGHTFLTPSPLPLLPSMAVGWSWRLFFLALCLGFVLLASRVGCWLGIIEVFP